MFSPSHAPPTQSVRTSRRRQRPSSSEKSLELPNPKRTKRSALSEQTFAPLDGRPEMEESRSHKTSALIRHENVREAAPPREIAMRGKKSRPGDRNIKGDGTVVLTTNDTFTVSRLPALPDRLRAETTSRQHGGIYSESGYALALTHTHAIVWPYAATVPSPETFTFALPHPSKHVSDPLPLGSLVSASASSSDPGLVVVIPSTGKITYWESISAAATLDLKLQRNGVELSIPGMLSGEVVIQILNAESAGFALAFSTGRIAYMSVRDSQGRPALSVQFLRAGGAPVSSGLFGSLRNALSSSSWRGDIAAVRAGRPERVGERIVVVATTKGKIQSWNIHRGGHTSFLAEAESRESISMAMKGVVPSLNDALLESFEIVDFVHTPKSVIDSQLSDSEDNAAHLLLLASLTVRGTSHYFLVEIVLNRDELSIGNVRPIKCYTTPLNRSSISKPRLYLPNPALVAYVVFDRAVVVVSMAKQPDSPDLQLRAESHILPQSFEDVIDFREDMKVEIVGSGMEEPHGLSHSIEDGKSRRHRAKHPAVVLIVRGGGIVRIAATDVTKLTTIGAQQVTAKGKLEQAIFYGTMDQNPLNFAVRPELQFSAEEVGVAALELSQDILKSQTSHIPSVPASIDQNLRKRSAALKDLAEYLKASGVALDRVTKWKLLWDAERMTAAALIWKRYDASIKSKSSGQKRGLLTEVVEFIHEDYKTEPVPEAGELDRVRHWFIKDIWNLEIAIPWAYQVIKYTYQDGQKDHSFVMEILSEADDLVLSALEGAFEFREANLALYGLESEKTDHGILISGYEGLPEFWTSTIYITENLRKQAELAGVLVKGYWRKPEEEGQPSAAVVNKVRHEYASLIDVTIRSNTERVRWNFAQDSPEHQSEAEQLTVVQTQAQDHHIILLATELGLADEAIDLAEKHEILPTLAYILQYELGETTNKMRDPTLPDGQLDPIEIRSEYLRGRVRRCFGKFGGSWATAFYEFEISVGSVAELLDSWPEEQDYLTKFLHSRPEYAKISWINDITQEKDFSQASQTLLDLGLKREQDMWSKKIELSMGKLALLATQNYKQTNGVITEDEGKVKLALAQNHLGLIKIQDQAFDFVFPFIRTAIDENAELQLAFEAYGNKSLRKQQSFATFLDDSMTRLIKHEAMDALTLIDLLSLMNENGVSDEQEICRSQRFYLALKATSYGLSKNDRVLTQRVIWRRCMLRDNWAEVNDTALKDDEQVSEQLARTTLYRTLKACFKNRLFDKDSNVQPINPQDILGAGTEELDHRFTGLDASIRENIMKDMQTEDTAFKQLIETSRLDRWYQSALEQAKTDFEVELSEETDGGKMMQDAEGKLEELEAAIKEKERQKAETLLHSKPKYKAKARINSGLPNFRSSIKQY